MRKIFWTVTLAASALGVSGAAGQQVVADSHAQIEDARAQMVQVLSTGGAPEDWDAALFVSTQNVVSPLLKKLEGTRISFATAGNLPAATLVLSKIELTPQIGAIAAHIEVAATVEGSPFPHFVAPIEALFFVTGFEEDAGLGVTAMVITPRITQLGPSDLLGSAAMAAIGLLMDLGTIPEIEQSLTVRVPLPSGVSVPVSIDETFEAEVGSGAISFAVSSPPATLAANFSYGALVTGEGIWALGRAGDKDIEPRPVGDLETALEPFASSATGARLFISGSVLDPVAAGFNALDQATRTVTVQSTTAGRLYEDTWRDKILGKGGFFVDLEWARGAIAAAALKATWNSDASAFAVEIPVNASAEGSVHVRLDPLVGGGASTSVGVSGGSSFTLAGTAQFRQLGDAADQGLWLVPDITCQSVPITVSTNGAIKLEGISIPAPSVGANFFAAIGKRAMTPIPLLTAIPMRVNLATLSTDRATITFPDGATQLQIKFDALSTTPSPAGVWLAADVHTSLVGEGAEKLRPRADLVEAVKNSLSAVRPDCPTRDHVEMLVGGIAIGPNNLALATFREAFAVAEKFVDGSGRVLKHIEEGGKVIIDVVEELPREIIEEVKDLPEKAVDEVKDWGKKTFGW